jgi:hypothetical protein
MQNVPEQTPTGQRKPQMKKMQTAKQDAKGYEKIHTRLKRKQKKTGLFVVELFFRVWEEENQLKLP